MDDVACNGLTNPVEGHSIMLLLENRRGHCGVQNHTMVVTQGQSKAIKGDSQSTKVAVHLDDKIDSNPCSITPGAVPYRSSMSRGFNNFVSSTAFIKGSKLSGRKGKPCVASSITFNRRSRPGSMDCRAC